MDLAEIWGACSEPRRWMPLSPDDYEAVAKRIGLA